MKYYEKPICGIYKITHKPSNKCYIGLSVDIFKRWKEHTNFAQAKKKWSKIKQALYDHLLEFSFEVIEVCDEADLSSKEIHWISVHNSFEDGYNRTRGG